MHETGIGKGLAVLASEEAISLNQQQSRPDFVCFRQGVTFGCYVPVMETEVFGPASQRIQKRPAFWLLPSMGSVAVPGL